jgi:bidirectional [NiFe] hydrogenase diaphorase subunit
MPALTLTIDGRLVSSRAGETLLQVIRGNGIDLPTLCYLEGVSPRGGCRLCMVEVAGRAKPQAACVTPAEEGLVVTTESERLQRYRRQIVELLLAERNHICSVCVVNGQCELQSLAARFGIDHVRYPYLSPRLPLDASHHRFGMDHGRCVLCARCVRTCDEVEGAHTLDLQGRGVRSRIVIDLNEPWGRSETCTTCGKCVQSCPTGALFEKWTARGEKERTPELIPRILAWRETHER